MNALKLENHVYMSKNVYQEISNEWHEMKILEKIKSANSSSQSLNSLQSTLTRSFESTAKLVGRHLPWAVRVKGQEKHLQQHKITFTVWNTKNHTPKTSTARADLQQLMERN